MVVLARLVAFKAGLSKSTRETLDSRMVNQGGTVTGIDPTCPWSAPPAGLFKGQPVEAVAAYPRVKEPQHSTEIIGLPQAVSCAAARSGGLPNPLAVTNLLLKRPLSANTALLSTPGTRF